jgi:hypothetical protein
LKISFAPAECHAWAIAQAILRLFATPKTTPTLPSRGCELMGIDLPNKAGQRKINREWTRMYTNKNPQIS